jgi:hypothetical protein
MIVQETHWTGTAISILQLRQIIYGLRQLDIFWCGDDSEFLDSAEASSIITSTVEANDFLIFSWL